MMNNMFKKHLKEKRTNKNFQKMIDETDNKTLDSLLGMVIGKRLGDCQDDSNTKNISEEELSDKSFVGYFENMNHMYHMYKHAREQMNNLTGTYGTSLIPEHHCTQVNRINDLVNIITYDECFPVELTGKDIRLALAGVSERPDGFAPEVYEMLKKFEETYFTGTRNINNAAYYALYQKTSHDEDHHTVLIPKKLPKLCKGTCKLFRTSGDADNYLMIQPEENQMLGADLLRKMYRQFNFLVDLRPSDAVNLDGMPTGYAYYLQAWINAFNEYVLNPSYTILVDAFYRMNIEITSENTIPKITIAEVDDEIS